MGSNTGRIMMMMMMMMGEDEGNACFQDSDYSRVGIPLSLESLAGSCIILLCISLFHISHIDIYKNK